MTEVNRKGARIVRGERLQSEALSLYTAYNENQLRHIYEPEPGVFIAESPNVIERALQGGYEALSFLVEEGELPKAETVLQRAAGVPAYVLPAAEFRQLTGFPMTRGLLCALRRRPLPAAEAVLRDARRIVVLENVVNPTNVGAIFRSAAALGMDAVLLSSGCSDPLYRRAARVSMGTVFQIPWTFFPKKKGAQKGADTEMLRQLGFQAAALALRDDSIGIEDPRLRETEKLALIFGTEGEGLLPETIAACDYSVKIPMYHGVDSLNVAAASAVACFAVGNRQRGV